MTTRRAVLAGGAALLFAGRARGATSVRTALDAAAATRDPGEALRLLAGFDPAGIAASERLDLITSRAGLAIDVAIMRLGFDPKAKGPLPRDPRLATLLLRRKLGFGIDPARASVRLEHERRLCTARADRLFAMLGIIGGDTGARFTRLWQQERYPATDGGRVTAIADMNASLAHFVTRVPALIGPVPPYCFNVVATLTGKPGTRILPTTVSQGGYIPDLERIADRPRWTLPSVVAHELIPGHMIQLPMEAAAAPHSLRLEYAPAFAEGWAIYTERLIARDGMYDHDPHAELGYLHWRLFRIGRALVDFDIHLHALPIEAARAKLFEWQGEPAYFAPFDADLARIAAEPMTRAAEMLAALAIEDGARGRYGAGLVRYHRMVLADGRMRSDDLARRARLLR